jgi:hypothetical protein
VSEQPLTALLFAQDRQLERLRSRVIVAISCDMSAACFGATKSSASDDHLVLRGRMSAAGERAARQIAALGVAVPAVFVTSPDGKVAADCAGDLRIGLAAPLTVDSGRFRVRAGDVITALDDSKWRPAEVLHVSDKGICVHWAGYLGVYDETILYSEFSRRINVAESAEAHRRIESVVDAPASALAHMVDPAWGGLTASTLRELFARQRMILTQWMRATADASEGNRVSIRRTFCL